MEPVTGLEILKAKAYDLGKQLAEVQVQFNNVAKPLQEKADAIVKELNELNTKITEAEKPKA